MWRFRQCRVLHGFRAYDSTNAFNSPSFAIFSSIFGTPVQDKEFYLQLTPEKAKNHEEVKKQFIMQHVQWHYSIAQVSNAVSLLKHGAGFPQGSTCATGAFNVTYAQGVHHFIDLAKDLEEFLTGEHPLTQCKIDTSVTTFVDNVGQMEAALSNDLLIQCIHNNDDHFGVALDKVQSIANRSKAQLVFNLFGQGTYQQWKTMQRQFFAKKNSAIFGCSGGVGCGRS